MTPATTSDPAPSTNPSSSAIADEPRQPADVTLSAADLRSRVVLSSLWASVLFVFAYVDIFGFFRADMIRGALAGVIPTVGFTVDQQFLVLTTLYVIVPSLMIPGSTMLPSRILRPLTVVLAVPYAIGIVVAMVGDPWLYFQLGSAVEIALLIVIARHACRYRPGGSAQAPRSA